MIRSYFSKNFYLIDRQRPAAQVKGVRHSVQIQLVAASLAATLEAGSFRWRYDNH